MAMVVVEKTLALVKEMEEDEVEEDKVEEEPPWPMVLTSLMSPDLSLTKNGELSQARADDMSMKSAIGSVAAPTKEVEEKLPQPLPYSKLLPQWQMLLLKSRLKTTMEEELGVLLVLEQEEPAVAVDEQAVDSDLLDAAPYFLQPARTWQIFTWRPKTPKLWTNF
jgi:hypothetical protein